LKFNDEEIKEIERTIRLCEENDILPDLHFTCPPLCILDYPKYNLEYNTLKNLEKDKQD
jgi:hypothetical protein